jgi:hypothetical protein
MTNIVPDSCIERASGSFNCERSVCGVNCAIFHIALISIGLYSLWIVPTRLWLSAIPLSISLLLLGLDRVFANVAYSTDIRRYSIYAATSGQYAAILFMFILSPLLFAILGLVYWPIAVYASILSAWILWGSSRSSGPNTASLGRTPSTACLCFVFLFFGSVTLAGWPYIDCHGIPFPMSVAKIMASTISAADMIGRGLGWWHGTSYGAVEIITQGQSVALVGKGCRPTVMLLSTQNVHMLLLLFILVGSLCRSLLFIQIGKLRSLTSDLIALVATSIFYIVITWVNLCGDGLSLHLRGGLGGICILVLWVVLRMLLMRVLVSSADFDGQTSIGGIQIPTMSRIAVPCVLFFLAGSVLLWHETGSMKEGRIKIDEYHSEWEKSDLPMTTSVYGVKTVYNYTFLKEILSKHYASVESSNEAITEDVLRNCDVLVLKTPTKPYSANEIATIRAFVENGGGLWLIGDHTNIFGMNTYLNQVSEIWGIRFNADAICPLPEYYQDIVHVELVPDRHDLCGKRQHETLYSHRYLNHPIISHNIPYAAVLTSCSVSAPLFCEYVTISRGTYADSARFGWNTFFGNFEYDGDENYGCILQNAALRVGRGRVATWSDSTIFSNFSMCMTGVPQLALGYANWLNHTTWLTTSRQYTICIVLCVCGVLACVAMRMNIACGLYAMFLSSVFVIYLVPILDHTQSWVCSGQDIRKGFPTIGFDQEYSQIELPNKDHIHDTDPRVFESFYVMMQRLGAMPVSSDSMRELQQCDVIVLTNIRSDMSALDVDILREAMTDGKTAMLVFNSSCESGEMEHVASRFNTLLSQLGVEERFTVTASSDLKDVCGSLITPDILMSTSVPAYISSCDDQTRVMLRCSDGSPVTVVRPYGSGRLVMCSVGDLYNNRSIGQPSSVPRGQQIVIAKSIVNMMSVILNLSPLNHSDVDGNWKSILGNRRSHAASR